MVKPIEVTQKNIKEILESNEAVMLDFWAPWCGPCRMIAPVIDELANDYDGKVAICKVNTDEEQDVAEKYGIRSIPTIVFIKNGEVVDQIVGATSIQNFRQKIDSVLLWYPQKNPQKDDFLFRLSSVKFYNNILFKKNQ